MKITDIRTYFLEALRRIRRSKLQKLRDNWGTIPEFALNAEAAELYSALNKQDSIHNNCRIDDDTWHDLDMDVVFTLMNRATSPTGAQYLYYLLKHPVFEERTLHSRDQLITAFSNNRVLREALQLALLNLAERDAKHLPYALWTALPETPCYARVFPILSFSALVVLLLVGFQVLPFVVLIPVWLINFIIHYWVTWRLGLVFQSFQYLGVLISVANKIQSLRFPELRCIQEALSSDLKDTADISKKIYSFTALDSIGLGAYIKIYFLLDISGFYSVLRQTYKHLYALRRIFETVGYLDSLVSVASFRSQCEYFCSPIFEGETYSVEAIYHPLLEDPVSNSLEIDIKNIMVTGSNMAGKTTFLKTLGVNSIVAQTINMSFARRCRAPFMRVISSIGRSDDLISGKSYYLAEVESILGLIQASEFDAVHLFIIDEIFWGTNSVERLAASVEVIDYLANGKDYTLIATHDLRLTELLNTKHLNFHFRETVSKEGLSFDYKLHSGCSKTRNAIALLDSAGYPNRILEKAKRRIADNDL